MNVLFLLLGDGLGLVDLGEGFCVLLCSDVLVLLISGMFDGCILLVNVEVLCFGLFNYCLLLVCNVVYDNEMWVGNLVIVCSIVDFLVGCFVGDVVVDVMLLMFVWSVVDMVDLCCW